MIARMLRILLITALVLLLGAGGGLLLAHRAIRAIEPPLPSAEQIAALPLPPNAPTSLVAVDTASQRTPRSQVLDPGLDPDPDAPYVMSHASFLLGWDDGRALLVDVGMEPDAARSFGRTIEWVGGEPAQPHGSAAQQLGARLAAGRLGLLLTHLHTDHVQGLGAICDERGGAPVELLQTEAQATRHNYTTRPGVALLAKAGCLDRRVLDPAPLAEVPGYPGVYVIHAAGHTPGSQVVVALLRTDAGTRTVVFTGDAVNCVDGARHDVPKPLAYRLFVVPENDERLSAVRRLLGALERGGAELAVVHDRLQLEALGLLPGGAALTGPADSG